MKQLFIWNPPYTPVACEWSLYWGKASSEALLPWELPFPYHAASQSYPVKMTEHTYHVSAE